MAWQFSDFSWVGDDILSFSPLWYLGGEYHTKVNTDFSGPVFCGGADILALASETQPITSREPRFAVATGTSWLAKGINNSQISRSTDSGVSWTNLAPTAVGGACNLLVTGGAVITTGPASTMSRSTDDGLTWTASSSLFTNAVNGRSIGPAVLVGSTVVVVGWHLSTTDVLYTHTFTSSDAGASWSGGKGASSDGPSNGPFTTDRPCGLVVVGSTVFAAGKAGSFAKSTNSGASWSALPTLVLAAPAGDPSGGGEYILDFGLVQISGVLVVLTNRRILYSYNEGVNWESDDTLNSTLGLPEEQFDRLYLFDSSIIVQTRSDTPSIVSARIAAYEGAPPAAVYDASSAATASHQIEANIMVDADFQTAGTAEGTFAAENGGHVVALEYTATASSIALAPVIFVVAHSGTAAASSSALATLIRSALHGGTAVADDSLSGVPTLQATSYGLVSGNATSRRDGEPLDVWVISEDTGAVSRYREYDFTSFGLLDGRHYGISEDGVYLLDGGATDQLDWSVDFGEQWFGDTLLKRLSHAYMGVSTSGTVFVRVEVGEQEYLYEARAMGPVRQTQRFDFGLGLRASCYELVAVGEGQAEVSSVEFVPVALTRRI